MYNQDSYSYKQEILMTPPGIKAIISFISFMLFAVIYASPEAYGTNIGIVFDGPSDINNKVLAAYKTEIGDLTEGEFTVRFPDDKIITADWTSSGVASAIERQLADPGVDILITLGRSEERRVGKECRL